MQDSIKAAIRNISEYGDTDVFPYSFERHLFRDAQNVIEKAVQELHDKFEEHRSTFPPQNITTLAPVGYTGFRWATQIDPLWNAYFLSLVIEMSQEIENARLPIADNAVFSYRLKLDPQSGRLFDPTIGWRAFNVESLVAAEKASYVILCDVSEFYARIYHHRVENALKWLQEKPAVVNRIIEVLAVFSNSVSYGLPVGGPASRILAELALNAVDLQLTSHKIRFCRFVDDYRIFCSTREEAYRNLILLSEKLFNEGLTLQKAKTRILSSKDFADEMRLLVKEQVHERVLSRLVWVRFKLGCLGL